MGFESKVRSVLNSSLNALQNKNTDLYQDKKLIKTAFNEKRVSSINESSSY